MLTSIVNENLKEIHRLKAATIPHKYPVTNIQDFQHLIHGNILKRYLNDYKKRIGHQCR